jgi:6-phosphogluconolactonase
MTVRAVIDELPQLALTCAAEFESTAAEVLARRERFVIALPGGSVATAFFPVLATLGVDWSRIDVFWIDERAVPPDHPDSNYAVALRLLLAPARVPPARIHRMPGELPDLDQAARRAVDELHAVAGDPPHLDLVLTGVGEDGHVASLFPGRPEARSDSKRQTPVIPIYDSPKPPARRLTLTLPVLADAGLLIVGAFGASKAPVVRDALDTRDAETPIATLLRRARSTVVLLDREAGLS